MWIIKRISSKYPLCLLGTIKEKINDSSFIVEDSAGDLERIWREDIICDQDDVNCSIQVRYNGN